MKDNNWMRKVEVEAARHDCEVTFKWQCHDASYKNGILSLYSQDRSVVFSGTVEKMVEDFQAAGTLDGFIKSLQEWEANKFKIAE